jgi:hypothetical protein
MNTNAAVEVVDMMKIMNVTVTMIMTNIMNAIADIIMKMAMTT